MALLAMLVFATTALPNWAVQFVYFPAKVVAKSTKLVPTMIVAVLMGNSNKFSRVDYASAVLLIFGSAGFALNSGIVDVDDQGVETVRPSWWIGLVLLTISSFADALVPNLQQSVMRAGASAEQVALRVNVLGAGWIFFALTVTGAIASWIPIFFEQPEIFGLMLVGSLTLGLAVVAFTLLIKEAGSVVAVAVATARKVATLTLSYLVFPGGGKKFGTSHALSALAVFVGMGLGPALDRFEVWRMSRRGRTDVASGDIQYTRV
jgi:adenosine 3'-phospho 5'-phosphosulfate transporter B3